MSIFSTYLQPKLYQLRDARQQTCPILDDLPIFKKIFTIFFRIIIQNSNSLFFTIAKKTNADPCNFIYLH